MDIGTGQVVAIFGIVSAVIGGIIWVWKKLVKPILKFFESHTRHEQDIKGLKEAREKDKKFGDYVSKKVDACIYLADSAMFICDSQGLCVLANDAMCDMLGASEREMMGQGWFQFIHERDRDRTMRIFEQVKHNNNADFKIDMKIVHGNTNEEVKCICHTIISRDRDKQILVSVSRLKK